MNLRTLATVLLGLFLFTLYCEDAEARRGRGRRRVFRARNNNFVRFNAFDPFSPVIFDRFGRAFRNPFFNQFNNGFDGFNNFNNGFNNGLGAIDPSQVGLGDPTQDNRLAQCAVGAGRFRRVGNHIIDCTNLSTVQPRPFATPTPGASTPPGIVNLTPSPSPSPSPSIAPVGGGTGTGPIANTTAQRPQSEQERKACSDPLGTVCAKARQNRVSQEQQTEKRREGLVNQALSRAGVTAEQLANSSDLNAWAKNAEAYLRALQQVVESPNISAAAMGTNAKTTIINGIRQESRNNASFARFQGDLVNRVNQAAGFESYITKTLRLTAGAQRIAALVDFFTTCSPDGMGLNARSDGAVCPYYLNNAVTDEQRRRVALHEIGHAIDSRGAAPLYSRYLACQGIPTGLGTEASADYWSFVGMASDLRGQGFDRVLSYAENAFSHYCAPLNRVLSGVPKIVQDEFQKFANGPDTHPQREDRIRHFANQAEIAALFNCRGGTGSRNAACNLNGAVSVNTRETVLTQGGAR